MSTCPTRLGARRGADLDLGAGNTKPHDLAGVPDHEEPTYIAPSVGSLLLGVPNAQTAPHVDRPGKITHEAKHARGEVVDVKA